MPSSPKYRKQRSKQGPNKNQLKVFRNDQAEQEKASAGTLRARFPDVQQLVLDLRMETPTGAILQEVQRKIGPDETLLLDVSCEGGCSNGLFLLRQAVEGVLQEHRESHQGMGICQAISYQDAKLPCNTKLYYRIAVTYA
jgi:hypothetical protein